MEGSTVLLRTLSSRELPVAVFGQGLDSRAMAIGSSQCDGYLASSRQRGRKALLSFLQLNGIPYLGFPIGHPRHCDWSTHSHRPAIASLLSSSMKLITLLLILRNFGPTAVFGTQMNGGNNSLTEKQASHFAALALKCVAREFPNKPEHVINNAARSESERSCIRRSTVVTTGTLQFTATGCWFAY
jgi:hypothetical protein